MAGFHNPAFATFIAEIPTLRILAQVRITPHDHGFELRHVDDTETPVEQLQRLGLADIRKLVDFTAEGQFRPLKTAPNLRNGWVLFLSSAEELELALNQFYPNAVPDWFAVKQGTAQTTDYRTFTARQTGMYRITAMLSDAQVSEVIRACCHRKFCLKQRLWTVAELPADAANEKSAIPCLEPCAILLEFARKGMRIEQEEQVTLTLSPSDIASLEAAVEIATRRPAAAIREADFAAAENSRRMQLALEKLRNRSGEALSRQATDSEGA